MQQGFGAPKAAGFVLRELYLRSKFRMLIMCQKVSLLIAFLLIAIQLPFTQANAEIRCTEVGRYGVCELEVGGGVIGS